MLPHFPESLNCIVENFYSENDFPSASSEQRHSFSLYLFLSIIIPNEILISFQIDSSIRQKRYKKNSFYEICSSIHFFVYRQKMI